LREIREIGLNERSDEADLFRVQRHVIEAERHVADLKRIVEELVRDKHPVQAEMARRVLRTLEQSLALARDHLAREEQRGSSRRKSSGQYQ
jgi:hypothetical protein